MSMGSDTQALDIIEQPRAGEDVAVFDGRAAIPRSLTHFIRYALDQDVHPQELHILAHADHRAMQLLLTLRQNHWDLTPGQWKELRARAPHVARIGGREVMLYRR